MCTLMLNDRPTLIAWTGGIDTETSKKKRRRRAKTEKVALVTAPVSAVPVQEARADEDYLSSELGDEIIEPPRVPVRYNDGDYERSYSGHRTNGKGGWIRRNHGRKPEYKDRQLRANGSGKARLETAAALYRLQ